MKSIKAFIYNNWLLLTLVIIHCLISLVLSNSFFTPIKDNAGSENIAYKYFATGTLLSNDTVVRPLCRIYSYGLALVFISLFWKWVFFLVKAWRTNKKYVVCLLALILVGIITIIGLYPATITSCPDMTYNYVYAKEWLPMYWHGFLTNILHCACLLFFTHPIALSIVPWLFASNILFYFTYHTIVKYSYKNKIRNAFIYGIFLLCAPETVQALTYAGRNYVYVTLCMAFFGTILKDNLEKAPLTKGKFVLLSILCCALATWRTEGLLAVVFFPFILFFVYFYKREKEKIFSKAHLVKGCVLFVVTYSIFSLPNMYGTEKYQGYDYFIINTAAPLSMVWANDDANLEYESYENDLAKITAVVPKEYFEKYGEFATQYYNWENVRLSRQSDAGDAGKDFLIGAYSILLHNWDIYLQYQMNVWAQSIGCHPIFDLQSPSLEPWSLTDEKAQQFSAFVMDHYSVGSNDIAINHDIVFINPLFDEKFSSGVSKVVNKIYACDIRWGGVEKIAISFIMIICLIHSIVKRRWAELIIGTLIMGLFAAVLLMAPAVRANYFYYSYFNQYWFILFYIIFTNKMRKNGGKVM